MIQMVNFYGQLSGAQQFDQIKINIASPEQVRSWSFGEVNKPETINYRTFKPEKEGLFCARIFGPVKDYECICGKYKRLKYRGITCEKCGVEVTSARVRRERMGHIELASPIAHIWFLKSLPSRISTLLNISIKDLEKILYFEQYVVVDPGLSLLNKGDFLSEDALNKAQDEFGENNFTVSIGAEVVQTMLADLDLVSLKQSLQSELINTNSDTKRKKIIKRLRLVEDFITSGNKPEWMIMNVLPVIPPDIRPLVMLDGGRFATSDLNELYRRVINRNNRLKRLLELKAPDIIIRNEKRMLQEAVDALFDNGRRGKLIKNSNKRAFKSLSDMLKGKQGRFRQNLLGKRVDYSGRSVIVVGPELKLHQCGIPKKMALELFKPFIYSKLELYGIASTIKAAKRMVESERPEVWDILEEVIREHPVLLNRAPTLHRLGIQAFEPLLIEGKAIQLHPLVCAAFNADFDGDQMAVHVPLSIEAQLEARVLMMSTNNILSPANGKPIIVPDKDIVLGLYYLTLEISHEPGEGMIFGNIQEVEYALFYKIITIHTKIKYRIFEQQISTIVNTTPGRLLLAELLPNYSKEFFDLVNKPMTKKDISHMIDVVYRSSGQKATVVFADRLMQLGFKYACSSGISFGMDDMVIPQSKYDHVEKTLLEVKEFEYQYSEGFITYGEKYNKVIDAWSKCTDYIANDMMKKISEPINSNYNITNQQKLNSIYMMADSGARGSAAQIKQLAGMRGLMAKPSGEIIETPIISNFLEGLSVLEYFNSTHGARKGLADTALKTSKSGHLTRILVDVAQDCIITEYDCGTTDGILFSTVIDDNDMTIHLSEQILGRTSVLNVYHPIDNKLLINSGDLISELDIKILEQSGVDSLLVRSVIMCKSQDGICAKCYGRDLSTGILVSVGEAVGVIAAQSIGEPGTQLTMRTFHIGGAATKSAEVSSIDATFECKIKLINIKLVSDSDGRRIVMNKSSEVVLLDQFNIEKARYKIPFGARFLVNESDTLLKGDKIFEWDPYTVPIITEKSGYVIFKDLVYGSSIKDITDDATGISNKVIIDSQQNITDLRPRIELADTNDNIVLDNVSSVKYHLPVNAILSVNDGSYVSSGDILARIPKESTTNRDITGGLLSVINIVEARRPKDHAIIADIDGYIEFGKDYKSKRRIILNSISGIESIEYLVQKSKHILVNEGDLVKKGDIIVGGQHVLQDILKIQGVEALSKFMINEIQSVYRLQGVKIDNKHIEVIIRQMLQKVEIIDSGDTTLLVGEKLDKRDFEKINNKFINDGFKSAVAEPILLGITKASLQTKSFISAASFQETTRVLTESAVAGKIDNLKGLKENVIVGRLIPAGTGFYVNEIRKQS